MPEEELANFMPKNWFLTRDRGADINLNQKSRYLRKIFKDEVKEEAEQPIQKSVKPEKKKVEKVKQKKEWRDPLE